MSMYSEDIIETAERFTTAFYQGERGHNREQFKSSVAAMLTMQREEADQREQRLQAALAYWMPGVTEKIEIELNGRCGDDAQLLAGFKGEVPNPSWGDTMVQRLKERGGK